MKTKKIGNRDLPASCFAYVGDPENPETWSLPYLNPDGSVDATHLADAAAALSSGGFRGQKVDLPAAAVAGVKAKLRAAYGKLGKKKDEIPAQLREAEATVNLAPGRLIEAVDDKGYEWLVCLIQAGLAKSGTFYPAEVLREAAPLFEGARAFARSDQEHLSDQNMSVQNMVGWHDQVQFQEADDGRLVSHFHVTGDAPWLAVKMRDAWDRNKAAMPGFSIVADGKASLRRLDGRMVRYAEAITKVDAVDPVLKASAGGHVIRMIQADGAGTGGEEEMKFLEQLVKMIEAERPELLQGKDKANLKEEEIMTLFREAMRGKPPENNPTKAKERDDLMKEVNARLKEAEDRTKAAEARFQEAECRNLLTAKLGDSKLPEITQKKIRKDFTARKLFTEADLDQAIKDEREYLASFHEAAGLPGLGTPAVAGVAERERILCALDGFFFDADQKINDQVIPRFLSFKEAYVTITGDKNLTGHFREAVNLRHFVEAVDPTAWATILGEAIHKRLLADFNLPGMQLWRRLASDITSIQDFKTNTRMRYGGYGQLPAVDRLGNYDELTTPAEEKPATFTVSKFGGLESLAMEDIANDDTGAIRRIPSKLARAAGLSLNLLVFGDLINNTALYGDSKALFHADHGNLGSTAFSRAGLSATRLAMRKQVEPGSNVSLGLTPRLLLVPAELEEDAFMICKGTAPLIQKGVTEVSDQVNIHQGTDYEVVPWFTDANDWIALDNSPGLAPLEVGFYQGRQDPELFVQDLPNVGSMFTADKISYKIRFIFGWTYLDYRPWYKHVV